VVIYTTQPQHAALRQLIAQHEPAVSAINYVEVLGYHKLALAEKQALQLFFTVTIMLPGQFEIAQLNFSQ